MCKRALAFATVLSALLGCGPTPEGGPAPEAQAEEGCAYPVSSRFAVDAVMPPFAWADAHTGAGEALRFDALDAHHGQALGHPFKLLAFIAVPAW